MGVGGSQQYNPNNQTLMAFPNDVYSSTNQRVRPADHVVHVFIQQRPNSIQYQNPPILQSHQNSAPQLNNQPPQPQDLIGKPIAEETKSTDHSNRYKPKCRYEYCYNRACEFQHGSGQKIETEGREDRVLTLFHVTNQDAALKIVNSRIMLPGSAGYAGGGIYFGDSLADCKIKLINKVLTLFAKLLSANL